MKKQVKHKMLAVLLAAVMLCAALPLGGSAGDVGRVDTRVNIISQEGRVTRESTLYLGEIFVDGESTLCYLYSDDVTRSLSLFSSGKDAIAAPFSEMMAASFGEEGTGVTACTDDAYEVGMDENWKDAFYAAGVVAPTLSVRSGESYDLYKNDAAFAAKCDEIITGETPITLLDDDDQPVDRTDGLLGVLSSVNSDSVTYTVEDGALVKNVDRDIDYSFERITVIYTAAYLKSGVADPSEEPSEPISDNSEDWTVSEEDELSEPSEPSDVSNLPVEGDADGDGELTMKDVLKIRKFIAGLIDEINEAAADVNRDGSVDMKDVLLVRKYIAGLITSFT